MLDNLTAAREQMALSLAFHIVFAVFGVGLPWLLLFAERRYLVTGDRVWYLLAGLAVPPARFRRQAAAKATSSTSTLARYPASTWPWWLRKRPGAR